jgi:hypothetical protein
MAKKSSRQVSKGETTASNGAGVSSKPSQRSSLSSRTAESAAPDFSYVKDDLKRVGILAGSMFAAMIILYFILPYILPLYAH